MGATAGIALVGASTGLQFGAQRSAARAARAQGAYESAVYEQDAQLAEQAATDAIARGREAELIQRAETRRTIGSQRAAFAAQGVDVETGSALDVQADTAGLGELDALTLRNNAAREAYGYRLQALDYRQHAELARMGARNEAHALEVGSLGTLLTGAANTYALQQQLGRPFSRGKA